MKSDACVQCIGFNQQIAKLEKRAASINETMKSIAEGQLRLARRRLNAHLHNEHNKSFSA